MIGIKVTGDIQKDMEKLFSFHEHQDIAEHSIKVAIEDIINIVLAIFVCLLIFPISIRIDETIAAVEIASDDKSYCQPVNIIISGTYSWRMVGNDTFDGNIKFDTYPLTDDIKKKFRELTKKYHPNCGVSSEKMIEVLDAYHRLMKK